MNEVLFLVIASIGMLIALTGFIGWKDNKFKAICFTFTGFSIFFPAWLAAAAVGYGG